MEPMELAPDQALSCSRESLLDLLMRQQTHGELGVRLGFHQDLLQPLPFQAYPFHFCALCGNQSVALYLYTHDLPAPTNITVATFAAAGVNGNTPWRKELSVSPKEVALLAGDTITAMVMANIERGIPLTWREDNHHKYPDEFREQARSLVESLCKSSWFLHLPGPARTRIIRSVIRQLTREALWSMLEPSFWSQSWQQRLTPQWLVACDQLIDSNHLALSLQPGQSMMMPQYQFRVATGQRVGQRRQRLLQFVKFGANVASWLWVLRRRPSRVKLLLSVLGAASGASLPTMLMVALTLLEQP